MMRRKTIQPIPCLKSRWTAWASRLAANRGRWTDAQRLSLPLYVRWGRTPLRLYQRWLSFHTQIHPQLRLIVAASGVWNIGSTDASAPQMVHLQSFAASIQKALALQTESRIRLLDGSPQKLENLKSTPAPSRKESAQAAAMTLAASRTRTEHLSSMFHRNISIRRESEFTEMSRRLTQRSQRVNEAAVVGTQMALRKEAPVAAMQAHAPSEPAQELSLLERRSSPRTILPMARSPLNVEQLADQVLKQIDRRVIARRERMGQV